MPFKDRKHAGKTLAGCPELGKLDAAVVVALPRGSVSVAVEVAGGLGAPLMAMPVEEIASPGSPEYIVGAVAENALHVIDSDALAALGVTENALAIRVAEATARIARLLELYRGDQQQDVGLDGRPIVVVDDGSASAPALEAVAIALRRHHVASIWLASVLPPETAPAGYDRILGPGRDAEQASALALIGGWFDDPSAPDDEAAAIIVREYESADKPAESLADNR